MIDEIEKHAPIGKSDHVGLLWTYTCNVDIATTKEQGAPRPNYNKANYDAMRNAFKDLDRVKDLSNLNSEEAWQKLKLKYKQVTDMYVL